MNDSHNVGFSQGGAVAAHAAFTACPYEIGGVLMLSSGVFDYIGEADYAGHMTTTDPTTTPV